MQTNCLADLLSTISNRSVHQPHKKDTRSFEELCRMLLSEIGDASAIKVARALLHNYRGMTVDDKRAFFRFLANDLDLDMGAIEQLARVDVDFEHLFSSWFNPDFLRWADKTMAEMPGSAPFQHLLQSQLTAAQTGERDPSVAEFRQILAHYLANQKRDDGAPVDSVARFHSGNGASLHDTHVAADLSDKGIKQPYGAMVNYLYKLNKLDHNIEEFTTNRTVVKSKEINALLKASQAFSTNRSN